ncbi:MAG: hypothetical protein UR29_C0016G0002 [Candidatus Woesebacteria bacterium GW2011_GWC2_33_12]|uniref:Uncharacterized protein n=1 Tax=Candidatus Woesebacteria bacterium GW2011_GWB1_33_22 TaxID=1618566 RepID=A0A0G0BYI9_9BACT|nr:MAG: hypothetical protein UR29_C0016G0002 [Candidatus Woesebacteria bacterium GW2011_GWC2_33_12]KKP41501.1 MAG: hypothetical protein UR33_C0014G0002 [Candidatus Woesebacteria bacterium GW2011_GWA2_33_20]KKP43940.1 MAG: hypothetical protein UR35_C0014G0013 [Candidatus Woesebacteria bacterium GW2011_GWB1_33_22]KKP45663.1 MAG: hypothetical protein UR37_C0016G0013 [Microgenomates group bacterium GW2011_GWC1_33_28]KKP49444.1 MAG: hypothetical protein UR41_C0015G0013 [Candidatus Woesebacteria bact
MSEITLASALSESFARIRGRVLIVETNAKGDRSKSAETLKVEVKDVKLVQQGNPNILVTEIISDGKGKKLSLGGNTKVK